MSMTTPEQFPRNEPGLLLFLPWEFDLLGGVDVAVDRLYGFLVRRLGRRVYIGIHDWNLSGLMHDGEGRAFLHLNSPGPEAGGLWLRARYVLTLLRRLPKLGRELKRNAITTVNFHYVTDTVLPVAILKATGAWRGRIVLSFHGSDARSIDPDSWIWRRIARCADAVTACSRELANRLRDTGLFAVPITVIPNGIDTRDFEALSKSVANPLDRRRVGGYFLNIGSFVPAKGQDTVLQAFAKIAGDWPGPPGLVFVGNALDGSWLASLRALALSLGVADRVVFLENLPLSGVAALMRDATCLVHASHREGLPLVLLEAGAMSLPVVATPVGGIPEVIPSLEYGWLFPVGDVPRLASCLREVLTAPGMAAGKGSRLHDHVCANFSVESNGAGFDAVLVRPR
jgi:glycosyltransferase involved in cell wall biosynthesis